METPRLDWSAAEVSDGVLTVPIGGETPKGFKDKFQQVVSLLGGGEWDEIVCKSGQVRVRGVTDGGEESLHHFLEGVMQETTAAFDTDEDGESPADENDDEAAGEAAEDEGDADARMTERFRGFGQ